jgi:hypothetical protein
MFVFHDFFPDPVVMVPCVFYIGKNGVPLEVSGGYVQPEELSNKLTNALQVSTALVFFSSDMLWTKRLQEGYDKSTYRVMNPELHVHYPDELDFYFLRSTYS